MDQETQTPPTSPAPLPPSAQGTCPNCGAPLYGKYCYACGQSATGLVRHFSSIISDAADSVFNVDERLLRTVLPLYLHPGRLTLDYFAGKRARYVAPFRLVFFLAIVVFLAFQLTLRIGATRAEPLPVAIGQHDAGDAPAMPMVTAGDAFDDGSIRINDRVWWNAATRPVRIAWFPVPLNAWINGLIGNAQRQLHGMNSGSADARAAAQNRLVLGMFGAAPTVLFVLLPFFALLLKVFYLFAQRLYMEHLIVAMHSQAFVLLSLLLMLAVALLRGWAIQAAPRLKDPLSLAYAAAWIWLLVYLFLMQKRVYRQGWLLTACKYCCIGVCYTILFGIGFTVAVLVSLTGA